MLAAQFLPSLLLIRVLLSLHHLHDISKETALYELVSAERASAVWALGACLHDPLLQTVVTCEFRTIWTHDSILNLTVTDETVEDFVHLVLIGCTGPTSDYISIDSLDTRATVIATC